TTAAKAAAALTAVQTDLRKAADRIESIAPPEQIKAQHAHLAKAVRDFADELDPVIAKLKKGAMTALQTVPTLKGLQEIQTASTGPGRPNTRRSPISTRRRTRSRPRRSSSSTRAGSATRRSRSPSRLRVRGARASSRCGATSAPPSPAARDTPNGRGAARSR